MVQEEDLLAYVQKKADPALQAEISTARLLDKQLDAELTLMENLKPVLNDMTWDVGQSNLVGWHRIEAELNRRDAAVSAHQDGRRKRFWMAAAVFFGLIALGEGAFLVAQKLLPSPAYQTASEMFDGSVLIVTFAPDSTEAEIRALLQSINGRIVDGPGASGFYSVAFDTLTARNKARQILNAQKIITMVADL